MAALVVMAALSIMAAGTHRDTIGCAHRGRRRWYSFDLTFAIILAFEKISRVWDVQHPGQSDTRKSFTACVDLANSDDALP